MIPGGPEIVSRWRLVIGKTKHRIRKSELWAKLTPKEETGAGDWVQACDQQYTQHVYVIKPQDKVWILRLRGALWCVNRVMYWDSMERAWELCSSYPSRPHPAYFLCTKTVIISIVLLVDPVNCFRALELLTIKGSWQPRIHNQSEVQVLPLIQMNPPDSDSHESEVRAVLRRTEPLNLWSLMLTLLSYNQNCIGIHLIVVEAEHFEARESAQVPWERIVTQTQRVRLFLLSWWNQR